MTGLKQAWNRWAIYQLAFDLGKGTIRMLPKSETDDLASIAEACKRRLLAFENREHDDSDQTAMYEPGFDHHSYRHRWRGDYY